MLFVTSRDLSTMMTIIIIMKHNQKRRTWSISCHVGRSDRFFDRWCRNLAAIIMARRRLRQRRPRRIINHPPPHRRRHQPWSLCWGRLTRNDWRRNDGCNNTNHNIIQHHQQQQYRQRNEWIKQRQHLPIRRLSRQQNHRHHHHH